MRRAHIITSEGGGAAALTGVLVLGCAASAASSTPTRCAPRSARRRRNAPAQTPGGGRADRQPRRRLGLAARTSSNAVAGGAHEQGMATHMDGARLMNAVVAAGRARPATWLRACDCVWLDFTKGLGAPLGAVLCGSEAFIDAAWRWKQRLGGSMRQGGHLRGGVPLRARPQHRSPGRGPRQRQAAGARAGADRRHQRGGAGDQPGVLRHRPAPGMTADELAARVRRKGLAISVTTAATARAPARISTSIAPASRRLLPSCDRRWPPSYDDKYDMRHWLRARSRVRPPTTGNWIMRFTLPLAVLALAAFQAQAQTPATTHRPRPLRRLRSPPPSSRPCRRPPPRRRPRDVRAHRSPRIAHTPADDPAAAFRRGEHEP